MENPTKTDAVETPAPAPRVEFAGEVLQQIRQHARSSMRAEICGVLIGSVAGGATRVTARIAGEGASQGGAHVTFTQDTWEHIYKVKDAEFASDSIVGWYHSHPGFGIFLSDYDLFIHENFFNAPHQVAWVFDPHSDEEGCFGWIGKKVEPLTEIAMLRKHRAPAPEQKEEEEASRKRNTGPDAAGPAKPEEDKRDDEPQRGGTSFSLVLLAFATGFVVSHYWQPVGPRNAQTNPSQPASELTTPKGPVDAAAPPRTSLRIGPETIQVPQGAGAPAVAIPAPDQPAPSPKSAAPETSSAATPAPAAPPPPPVENKPVEGTTPKPEPAESKPAEPRPPGPGEAIPKPAEPAPTEPKPADGKADSAPAPAAAPTES